MGFLCLQASLAWAQHIAIDSIQRPEGRGVPSGLISTLMVVDNKLALYQAKSSGTPVLVNIEFLISGMNYQTMQWFVERPDVCSLIEKHYLKWEKEWLSEKMDGKLIHNLSPAPIPANYQDLMQEKSKNTKLLWQKKDGLKTSHLNCFQVDYQHPTKGPQSYRLTLVASYVKK